MPYKMLGGYLVTMKTLCANADIRSNVFTADKNWMQARIAYKTADIGLKTNIKFSFLFFN